MASQDEILLAAVIKQIPIKGIDYRVLARDMGLSTAAAAKSRWQRYSVKLKAAGGGSGGSDKGSPGKPVGVQKSSGKGKKNGRINVRDVKTERESPEEAVAGDTDGEGEGKDPVVSTPTRKLPGRSTKSKIKKYKVEDDEEEEEEMPDDEEEDEEELDFENMDQEEEA